MRRMLTGLLTLALLAAACSGDGTDDTSTTTTLADTSTTTISAPPPSTTPPPVTVTTLPPATTTTVPDVAVGPGNPDVAGLPAIAAAFAELGDGGPPSLAVVDPTSGRVTQQVAGADALGEGSGDLARAADGSALYYSRVVTACASEMVAVDTTTFEARSLGPGEVPTPSPDGRFLAYVIDPACRRVYDLVVRDLASGAERVWESELPDDERELIARIPSLSWSPDGTTIAFELVLEDGEESRIVDVTTAGGELAESERLDAPDLAFWSSPTYLTDGGVAVVERCCEPGTDDRAIVRVAAPGAPPEVIWDDDAVLRILDVDEATGSLLVLIERPDGSSAVVALVDGNPVVVAEDAGDAVWLEFEAGS